MRKFKKTYIEITNICNLACDFCPKTKRKAEFMDIETFENILNQIQGYSYHLYLHVKGEPFLHPQIDKFLDRAQEKGFKVNITTNGTLIEKVKHKILMKPALRQINFSLHSFDANENDTTMEEYLENILQFSREALEETNKIISLRLWNLEENNKTNIEIQRNKHILNKLEEFFQLDFSIAEEVVKGRGIKLKENLYLNQAARFKWPDKDIEELNDKGFCYGLRDQIAILVDGTVVPCCLDGEGVINLGNINSENFSEIIEGTRAKNIYEGFSRREIYEELCKKCDYRRRFNL